MKKIYTLSILLLSIQTVLGQVVFSDNLNTSTGTAYSTAVGAIGTSTVWNFNRSGVDMGVRIDGGILDCTNDGSASANANGWIFGNTATGSFTSPYNTQLNLNASAITWTFNMRQIRTDPAGFGVGSYGVAFILAGSSNNGAASSTGYAVALGQTGTTDPIRLIKYNNGLQGAIANIITSNTSGLTDFGNEYLSIKVTYTPSTDTWELFVRNDGSSTFTDPATGALTSQGTAVDNTFTGQVLGFMGGYWQGNTGATQTAFFDNVKVSLASTNSANSDIIADATFTTPTNINYSQYQGVVLTLANSIEVAKFTIRDGGGSNDADTVGTILTDISFSLSNNANVRRVAIYDGASELDEVAGGAAINFTGLSLTASDNGTKTFSLRVVFTNTVTDNQQFQFTVTAATASIAGSQFATTTAGGASSSIVSDDNRIEVIADGLTYLTNAFSPTGNGVAMAPAVQIGGTDTLNFGGNLYTNLDADFIELINITSTGTLSGSPAIVAAVAGVATFSSLIHTVNGTGFTLNAERTTTLDWDVTSNPFNIINSSNAANYFRSIQSGNWNNPTTWQSSADNLAWQASTLVPDSFANTITIRNLDTVIITADANADQLLIDIQGVLQQNNSAIFTINNGLSFSDMFVNGTFILYGRQPVGAGSISVSGGGHVLVESNSSPSESDDFAFGNPNVIFTGSFFDWNTTTSPSWSGRTYFNTGSNSFFRFLSTPNLGVGGASPTVINGILVAQANLQINGSGSKTFTNGIVNIATIDASTSTGVLNIPGNVGGGELGGVGTIFLPPAGLNIGPTTTVGLSLSPLTPTKTLSGDVHLLGNSYVYLTDTDLTITGNITGTSSTSYFITNGLSNAGKLFRPNIGATPVTFPIGFGVNSYNPVTISNGSNLTYGVRVSNTINPPIVDDSRVVNRTWVIIPSATPVAPVNVIFNYAATHGNPGFNYGLDVEVGLYTNVWNVIQTGLAASGSGPYDVATIINAFGANIEAPIIIGNLGAILAVQKSVSLTGIKQNNTVKLNWKTNNLSAVKQFVVEYSTNGINYLPLVTKAATDFSYVDDRVLNGKIYYRIKAIDFNNSIIYSNIVTINNEDLSVLSLLPTITSSSITINATSIKQENVQVIILDAVGKQIVTQAKQLLAGQNSIVKNVSHLANGIYYVVIYYANGNKATLKFVKM
jgi:hypothetical protein